MIKFIKVAKFFSCVLLLIIINTHYIHAQKTDMQWSDSAFASGGIELKNDIRIFYLFTLFNMIGFDYESRIIKEPVFIQQRSELRTFVRKHIKSKFNEKEIQKFRDFIEANQLTIDQYLKVSSYMSPELPFNLNKDIKDKNLIRLKQLPDYLVGIEKKAKLSRIYYKNLNEKKKQLLKLRTNLDKIMGPIEEIITQIDFKEDDSDLEAGEEDSDIEETDLESDEDSDLEAEIDEPLVEEVESKRIVLVINWLDAYNMVRVLKEADSTMLVFGPWEDDKLVLRRVVFEYIKQRIEPHIEKGIINLNGAMEQYEQVKHHPLIASSCHNWETYLQQGLTFSVLKFTKTLDKLWINEKTDLSKVFPFLNQSSDLISKSFSSTKNFKTAIEMMMKELKIVDYLKSADDIKRKKK